MEADRPIEMKPSQGEEKARPQRNEARVAGRTNKGGWCDKKETSCHRTEPVASLRPLYTLRQPCHTSATMRSSSGDSLAETVAAAARGSQAGPGLTEVCSVRCRISLPSTVMGPSASS
jgi:hypothetical protein